MSAGPTFIGPEKPVDEPVLSITQEGQYEPAMAFDGTNYLVVWEDRRHPSRNDIWAARVTPGGVVLDATGIQVSASGGARRADVAFCESNYIVVWNENWAIRGARISVDGVVIQQDIIISATGDRPKIAWGTNICMVTWDDDRDGPTAIYGTPVQPNGTIDFPLGIKMEADTHNIGHDLAFDGSKFRIVWNKDDSVTSKRIELNGAPDDASKTVLALAKPWTFPVIACSASDCLVAWDIEVLDPVLNYNRTDLRGIRVNKNNQIVGQELTISAATHNQQLPSIAFNGANYLVTWVDFRNDPTPDDYIPVDTYANRINGSGVVLDGDGFPIHKSSTLDAWAGDIYRWAVASNGSDSLVAFGSYQRSMTGFPSLVAARVSGGGTVLDSNGILVGSLAQEQRRLSLASNGTNHVATWGAYLGGMPNNEVHAVLLDETGTPSGQNPILVDAGTATGRAIASNGSAYLFAWYRGISQGGNNNLKAALWDAQGNAIQPPFEIRIGATLPAVASDGQSFLVVWVEGQQIRGARIEASGVLLDPMGFDVTTPATTASYPTVAFDGTNYVVVWEDRGSGLGYSDIHASRINTIGQVQPEFIISDAPLSQHRPQIACGNGVCVVVWLDEQNAEFDVYMSRFQSPNNPSPGGTLIATNTIDITYIPELFSPAISTDGKGFYVFWAGGQAGVDVDLYAARISSQGDILNPGGIIVADEDTDIMRPALSVRGPGNLLVGYERFQTAPSLQSLRILVRQILWPDYGEPCGTTSDCQSGFCVDGVCCNEACNSTCLVCNAPGSIGTCSPEVGPGCGGGGAGGTGTGGGAGTGSGGAGTGGGGAGTGTGGAGGQGGTGGSLARPPDHDTTSMFACTFSLPNGGGSDVLTGWLMLLGLPLRRLGRRWRGV